MARLRCRIAERYGWTFGVIDDLNMPDVGDILLDWRKQSEGAQQDAKQPASAEEALAEMKRMFGA
jgi:hypothetical protein